MTLTPSLSPSSSKLPPLDSSALEQLLPPHKDRANNEHDSRHHRQDPNIRHSARNRKDRILRRLVIQHLKLTKVGLEGDSLKVVEWIKKHLDMPFSPSFSLHPLLFDILHCAATLNLFFIPHMLREGNQPTNGWYC